MLTSLNKLRVTTWLPRTTVSLRLFSDDEREKKFDSKKSNEPKKSKGEAIKRLNSLLESMSTSSPKSNINIPTAPKRKPPTKEQNSDPNVDIKKITEVIAKKIGGDVEKIKSELLSKLLAKDHSSSSLGDVISGMKVDSETDKKQKRQQDVQYSRAQNVRNALDQSEEKRFPPRRFDSSPTSSGSVNLFGAEPLGIFTIPVTSKSEDPLKTWQKLQERELKLAVTNPPNNYFEKMIMWTEQGKVWKFPIDNEQGLEEEKNTDFSEHIMLEAHLEGWCPTKGPVRHFMELVCVGLSKSHYLSVKEKKAHLVWYRDYFNEKKDILGELMTAGREQQKQIENQ